MERAVLPVSSRALGIRTETPMAAYLKPTRLVALVAEYVGLASDAVKRPDRETASGSGSGSRG